jgi:hypothetical protein
MERDLLQQMGKSMPCWLHSFSVVWLIVSGVCSLVIVMDLLSGNQQKMWIMNLVWPVTALYAGPLAVLAYYRFGRLSAESSVQQAKQQGRSNPAKQKPFWQVTAVAATHCGAGCALGDIASAWLVAAFPVVLFGEKVFGEWAVAFGFAFVLGIAFQYFTIVPMRGLGFGKGVLAALKADTLSLTAWQVGMYGWMGLVHFGLFGEIPKTSPVFWFMMQIAMLAGFLTSYPVNWWLVKSGIKEKM